MGTELNRLLQKYNLSTPGMARALGAMGRGNDSLVAHITPEEAMFLKQRGGAGTINPRTGLLEFYDSDGDGGSASDSSSPTGGDEGGGNATSQSDATAQAMADVDAAIAQGFGPESPGYGGPQANFSGPAADFEMTVTATPLGYAALDTQQLDAAIAQGFGPESPGYGAPSMDTTSLSDAIAMGFGPESPGYGNLGLDTSDPSNAIALGYGPESPGWGSPVDNSGGGGGGGYNDGGGGNGGSSDNYIPGATTPPTATSPVATTPPATTTAPAAATPPVAKTPAAQDTFQFAAPVSPAFYGFELNRLMQQYGVPAPTIMPYGGTAPTTAQADAAKATYDKKVYDNYVNEYQNRLANTNMYNRAQFIADPAKFKQQYATPIANPVYAPANYGGIANTYSKYFGREPEQAGVEYWGKTGLTGDELTKAVTGGAQNADLEYLRKTYPNMGFARGGRVRYAEGGEVDPSENSNSFPGPNADEGSFISQPLTVSSPPTPPAPAPAAAAPPTRAQNLEAMLSRYTAPSGDYTRELAAARQTARTETEAFSNMIRQMAERGESPTSRAEMYFRLASAFGSPTKTGQFTENLALAGKEMGEYAKGRRADEAERRGLALKAQELRMAGARQDLATTQALAAQEGSERRAMAREVIKEYIASGRPQSDAGKMAQDAGLIPGTPEYAQFVDRYIKTKMESGDLYRQAMLAIQEGNLELRRMAEARKLEAEKQLTPQELKMKQDAENSISAGQAALKLVNEALDRNTNSFGMAGAEYVQYQALSRSQSTNPRVVNTQQIENILSRSAIDALKEKFGAGITNEERRALTDLAGAFAKTREERRIILERTKAELESSISSSQRRFRDISSGAYRQQTPPAQTGGGQ